MTAQSPTVGTRLLSPDAPVPATVDLASLVEQRLRRRGYLVFRDLRCEMKQGVLSLHGRLPSYHLLQVALATIADVEGIHAIDLQIEIQGNDAARRGDRSAAGLDSRGDTP